MTDELKRRAILSIRMIEMNKDGPAKEAAKRVCKADLLAFVEAHNGK